MSFSKEYAQMVQDQKDQVQFLHPLISGGEFFLLNKKENRCLKEYAYLLDLAGKRQWKQVPNILESLHNPATALVLTDSNKKN